MLETLLALSLLAGPRRQAPAPAATTSPAATPADTLGSAPRPVREFPPVEVRALLHDLRSSQTVHVMPAAALRALPVDGLTDVLSLLPGVVAQGEELHVRGGRSGEIAVTLDGLALNEPLRRRPIELPLLAIRNLELVSGSPEARHGGGLAGVLDLKSVDPEERFSGAWRWTTDGRRGTHYDRASGRFAVPLPRGLGLVAAGDATLDDTWLPALRTENRRSVAGLSFGWRAENRMLGWAKLGPVRQPERISAQLMVGRRVQRPYSPSWTLDGWSWVSPNLKVSPIFSPDSQPGYHRYRAADHLALTDDRQVMALLRSAWREGPRSGAVSLGWLRTRTVTSVGGQREPETAAHRPRYGNPLDRDGFHVYWGDYSLYRESATDVVTLRADGEFAHRTGGLAGGAALFYEDVYLREMDWLPFAIRAGDEGLPEPLDSLRTYHARAPGGSAYLQGRWQSGGLVLNAGVRAEHFSAGPEAGSQTLPGPSSGRWSIAPRLGVAYPISVRDVFSLAYVRIHQSPGRDFLYDRRVAINNRQPLGNPALDPALLISYQAAVKHLFDAAWALQSSVFYRDVFNQIGAVNLEIPEGPINLQYTDQDRSHAAGFELSLLHDRGAGRRLEAHYVWLSAWGNESRPEGDPYGPVRSIRIPPIGEQPVSWDRRHTLLVSGQWTRGRSWSASWSSELRSGSPWTPKPRRAPFTDPSAINSRRLSWTENTNVNLQWSPPWARGGMLGLEVRNLFDHRSQIAVAVDGYPNPVINTQFDDYGAYREESGRDGAAYWSHLEGRWIPVNDPRLYHPPRAVRVSLGARW